VTATVPMVVVPGRSHGHRESEHSQRRRDGLRRLEERQHRSRSDGTLKPQLATTVSPEPILHDAAAVTLRWVQGHPSALGGCP